MKKIFTILIVLFSLITLKSNAQLDTLITFCESYIKPPFLSDGQQYRAILTSDQTAEFRITFYGGVTYRIVAATEPKEGSVILRLYDKYRNELFSNDLYNYSNYWDFHFDSTVDCYLEAELPENKQTGFVIMFLGFKQ